VAGVLEAIACCILAVSDKTASECREVVAELAAVADRHPVTEHSGGE
jgi:hypothetical protein